MSVTRFGGALGVVEGSRRIGVGSRERFALSSATLFDLRLARMSPVGVGGELGLSFFPPPFELEESHRAGGLAYGQAEAALDFLVAQGGWGSVVVGVGGGGDVGRHWWKRRVYPLALVRHRLWLSQWTKLEVEATTVPVAATAELPLFEQRFGAYLGIEIFSVGARFTWTAATGGQPERMYVQRELTAFAGVSW